jgi:predicted DNA-binding transcriptional regulator AlpA
MPVTIQHPRSEYENTREVLERVPFGRDTLDGLVKSGRFPAPVRLNRKVVLFRKAEVDAWLQQFERRIVPSIPA